jgi:hypothetical protein
VCEEKEECGNQKEHDHSQPGVPRRWTAPAKERQHGKRYGHDNPSAIEEDEKMMGEQKIIYSESEWGENSQ